MESTRRGGTPSSDARVLYVDICSVVVLENHYMVPTVMESHGILASHGKSWKMERVMEKSWNFNHLFSEKTC